MYNKKILPVTVPLSEGKFRQFIKIGNNCRSPEINPKIMQ